MSMRIAEVVFLFLINRVLAGGGGGKHHVHFRIHVPDIIKHHIHTKTVFVHHHPGGEHHGGGGSKKTPPKKKETHHEQSHQEDWNSWSSYGDHGGHGQSHESGSFMGFKDYEQSIYPYALQLRPRVHFRFPGHLTEVRVRHPHQNPGEHHQGIRDNVQNVDVDPRGTHGGGGLVGYSYPPQYGPLVHGPGDLKEVTDVPHNEIEEPYNEMYEEGYRKGHHSQTGHLLSKDLNNFYDSNFEEADALEQGYNGESFDNHGIAEDSKKDHQSSREQDSAGYDYYGSDSYLRAE